LTKVDQGGSLGVVSDVFEVMAQVDHRLTKVNSFDWIIRFNNPAGNLGHHSLPPLNRISPRDSTTRLEQLLPTMQGLQRWNIYSLTLLDSENSNKVTGTWGSPHCLNAVLEEAGDGCVHEKLKEDKLH
jgi:hypothetical protein